MAPPSPAIVQASGPTRRRHSRCSGMRPGHRAPGPIASCWLPTRPHWRAARRMAGSCAVTAVRTDYRKSNTGTDLVTMLGQMGTIAALTALLAGQAAAQEPVRLVVNADLGQTTISKFVYGQFGEHLGRNIY